MRVLLANKFFYPKGGSEAVFFLTRDLLERHGLEVVDFAMDDPRNVDSPFAEFFAPTRSYTDSRGGKLMRVRDAGASVYSVAARKQMRRLIAHTRPDVAHLHNIYYQLTFSIVDELHAQQIPIVMTLHDPQIACPSHLLYRDAHECRDCVGRFAAAAVRHRCIKGSAAASAIGALEASLSRIGRKVLKIDRLIAPSHFIADVASATGFPAARIDVIPNFLPESALGNPVAELTAEPRFLYAAQLEEHKGLLDLLAAFIPQPAPQATLVIAGDGSLRRHVEQAAKRNPHIAYLGRLSRDDVARELRRVRAALLPARWPENNPMSVLEAQAAGIPVIVAAAGGIPEMVTNGQDGLTVPVGDKAGLSAAIKRLAQDVSLASSLGRAGYDRVCRRNTASRYFDNLLECYAAASHATTAG